MISQRTTEQEHEGAREVVRAAQKVVQGVRGVQEAVEVYHAHGKTRAFPEIAQQCL